MALGRTSIWLECHDPSAVFWTAIKLHDIDFWERSKVPLETHLTFHVRCLRSDLEIRRLPLVVIDCQEKIWVTSTATFWLLCRICSCKCKYPIMHLKLRWCLAPCCQVSMTRLNLQLGQNENKPCFYVRHLAEFWFFNNALLSTLSGFHA